MRKIYIFSILLIITIFVIFSCTKNPFGNNDNNKIEKEKIHGKIILDNGVIPNNIFVWLEVFNVSTTTDSSGAFSLILPVPEIQAQGNNLDGKFHLFFYTANYIIDSVSIEFSQGKLLKNQQNINNNQILTNQISLNPLIDFKISGLDSIVIFETETIKQSLTVELFSYDKRLFIHSLREDEDAPTTKHSASGMTGVIFEPIDKNYNSVMIGSPNIFQYNRLMPNNFSYYLQYNLLLKESDFEEIQYYIHPYLIINQVDVPNALFDALGKKKMEFGLDYIYYPFCKSPTIVKVVKN